jgi:hypothetical protein
MFAKSARSKIVRMDEPGRSSLFGRLKAASRVQEISLDTDRYLYLDDWAVSAYEKFGLNDNDDGFERDELKRSYGSFVGSWVCLDHDNDHPSKSVGENIDAVYMPEDYVRVAMAIDRERAHKRHPGLEQKILTGAITDSSMGCICQRSICTIPKCANVALDESQFCEHVIPQHLGGLRGRILCDASTNFEQVKCGELNRGVHFFENSIITDAEGADRNAKLIEVFGVREAVTAARTGEVSISAHLLLRELKRMASLATISEKATILALSDKIQELIP